MPQGKEQERTQFVVEIKSTIWEGRTAAKQRALLLRHMRQMHDYLDVLVDDIGRTVDSVVPALLYPQRPSAETVEQLEAIALPKASWWSSTTIWTGVRTHPEMMLTDAADRRCPVKGRPTDHRYPAAHPLSGTDSPGTRSREAIRFRVLHTFPLESGSRDGL
jgi:hypothetical protein